MPIFIDNLARKSTFIKFIIRQRIKLSISWFCCLENINGLRIQNNFNGFSMIDIHKNATFLESFEGDRSRVIGNHCNWASIMMSWKKSMNIFPFFFS